jgi:hypothetical protein
MIRTSPVLRRRCIEEIETLIPLVIHRDNEVPFPLRSPGIEVLHLSTFDSSLVARSIIEEIDGSSSLVVISSSSKVDASEDVHLFSTIISTLDSCTGSNGLLIVDGIRDSEVDGSFR